MNATLKCDHIEEEVILLPSRAILTLELHSSVETETFFIDKLNNRQLREVNPSSSQKQLVEFELEHKALSAEKIQNLTTHKILTENRRQIESLIKKNAENKNYTLEQDMSSNQRWENINVGMDQSEKIVTWSTLSILGFFLVMLAGWVARLQVATWKRNSEGTAA